MKAEEHEVSEDGRERVPRHIISGRKYKLVLNSREGMQAVYEVGDQKELELSRIHEGLAEGRLETFESLIAVALVIIVGVYGY